jgi:hypothetical protein
MQFGFQFVRAQEKFENMEKLLRQYRMEVFTNESRVDDIEELKRILRPYWAYQKANRTDNSAMSATHGW